MARIEDLIFGYRSLKFNPENIGDIVIALYKNGIPFSQRDNYRIDINETHILGAIELLNSKKTSYEISSPKGLLGKMKHYKHKAALISALIFVSIFVILLSNIVWDVRIEGNELLTEAAIISELEESGLHIGASWDKINKGKIEIDTLSNNGNISWININRRGTVAYVVIKEKKSEDINEDREEYLYSNIVAAEDCIIEDISVSAGIPLVEIGDVVKKGDILILGANSSENGGGFCKAEGEVIGRVYGHESTEVLREVNEKTVCDMSFSGMTIKIFNFPINIFKTYRNLDLKCDIIEEKSTISFFGICNLPLEIIKSYRVTYSDTSNMLKDDQLVELASFRLNSLLYSVLSDVDLCSIKTYGEFTDRGYMMQCDFVYTCSVARRVPINMEEK